MWAGGRGSQRRGSCVLEEKLSFKGRCRFLHIFVRFGQDTEHVKMPIAFFLLD